MYDGSSGGGGSGGGDPQDPLDFWIPSGGGGGYGEPTISYPERIEEILATAGQAMPFGSRRAALKNRTDHLNDLATTIDQGQLFEEMQYSLYGIYYLASRIQTRSEAKNIGHFLATQLQDDHDPAVRVQTLQTALLAAVTEALQVNQPEGLTLNAQQMEGLARSVMEMAYTYALWNPTEPDAAEITPGFLNQLWQSQLQGQTGSFSLGVTQLRDLLQGVNDPVGALNFINNLLQAAHQVVGLNTSVTDPGFVQQLLEFGFAYAKLNPDTSLSTTPQGFLDTLWRATPDDAAAMKAGAAGLSEFFDGANTQAQVVKRLTFAETLIEAAKLAPSTQGQVNDPSFVDALIGLGSAYAALDPVAEGEIAQDPQLFLDTLYRQQDVPQGVQQLEIFFKDPDDPNQILFDTAEKRLKVLEFERKMIQAFKLVPTPWEEFRKPTFIDGMINAGASFVSSQFNEPIVDQTKFFIGTWDSSTQDLKSVANIFNSFVPTSFNSDTNKDKSISTDLDDETPPLDEGILYAILNAPIPPTDPDDLRCFNLIYEIIKLGQELVRRYDEMRKDFHNLYVLRNKMSDPKLPGNPDPGSWEGHQEYYDKRRKELQKKIEEFQDDPNCDDDDPHGYGGSTWEDLFNQALEYSVKVPPKKPDPKPFMLPDWAKEAGVKFVDGILFIPKAIGIILLVLLMLLVNAFGIDWQFV